MAIYGIWCYDARNNKGDWLRPVDNEGLLAFFSKRMAYRRAAREYGYPTYTAAKRDGWCEVRPIVVHKSGKR